MKLLSIFIITFLTTANLAFGQNQQTSDTITWSEEYRLTWMDFRGEPLEFTGLGAEATCFLFASYSRPTAFSKIKCNVSAVFDRSKSWASLKAKNELALNYFRLMFDLYELHARKLRKDFSETKFPLDPNPLFQQKYNNAMTGLTNEFNEFRKQTKMGTDSEALKFWKDKVAKDLGEYNGYLE
ncbi:MAG: hypothetical protein JXB00_05220 [Bacteroidales bacterium]|nr:hypothetical protein [Bacteroidales bacterium]